MGPTQAQETAVFSRRARKKARTRNAIEDAALDLFEIQGFSATTIAAIADRADVAVATFFLHFPTKEDVLFPPEALARWGEMLDALRVRPSHEGALTALWTVCRTSMPAPAERRDRDVRRARIVASEPSLVARRHVHMVAIRDSIVGVLAERGPHISRQDLRLLVATTIATIEALSDLWVESDQADITPAVDRAEALLAGGFGTL